MPFIAVPRIELGRWFDEPFGKLWTSYNEKIGKPLQSMTKPPRFIVTTSKGRTFDLSRLEDRTKAIYYKIKYAARSLEELTKMYEAQLEALKQKNDLLGGSVKLTEDLSFHTDVFFSFLHSAMDYSSWMLYYTYDVKLIPQHVTLKKVVENLSSKKRKDVPATLRTLKKEFQVPGWIFEFEGYRDYVTHFARLETTRQIRFSAETGLEVSIFLLPDDPTVVPVTYAKKRELVPYCNNTILSVIGTVSIVFDAVAAAL
jgi:hypothetical protein